MDTNDINSGAVESRIREILNSVNGLRPGNASSNDSNVVLAETERIFKMSSYFTEPALSSDNGEDSGPGFVLDVNALVEINVRNTKS